MQHPQLIIVDDDEFVRSALHALAQEAMPAAHVADHGSCSQALEQIEADGADLIITNCHMPDMDGPTFVRTLREKHFTQPIIMVSGSEDARRLGTAAGIDRFVEKRYLDPDLAYAIHTLLKCA
jgi:CheY-like chemotaxis protein